MWLICQLYKCYKFDTFRQIFIFRILFIYFLVKRCPGRGPEQRESEKTVLCPQIIIILIIYIMIYYYKIINYQEPSQPKPETELIYFVYLFIVAPFRL
jgi:hypothetical protein